MSDDIIRLCQLGKDHLDRAERRARRTGDASLLLMSAVLPFQSDDAVRRASHGAVTTPPTFKRPTRKQRHIELPVAFARPDLYGRWPFWLSSLTGLPDETIDRILRWDVFLVQESKRAGGKNWKAGDIIPVDRPLEQSGVSQPRLGIGADALRQWLARHPGKGPQALRQAMSRAALEPDLFWIQALPVAPVPVSPLATLYSDIVAESERMRRALSQRAANIILWAHARHLQELLEMLFLVLAGLRARKD